VVGSLLVAVVETVDAREQDPQREGRGKERDLPDRRDPVDRRGRWGEPQSDDVGDDEPDDIRNEQQSPHEPSASSPLPLEMNEGLRSSRSSATATTTYGEVEVDGARTIERTP
jgi:hypothetical protein